MKIQYREIERVEGVGANSIAVECRRCGSERTLYFNGGELDEFRCCGLTYRTEHVRIDLVVYEETEVRDGEL